MEAVWKKKILISGSMRLPLDWKVYSNVQVYRACTTLWLHWMVQLSPHMSNWCCVGYCYSWGTWCVSWVLWIHWSHHPLASCVSCVSPWIQLYSQCKTQLSYYHFFLLDICTPCCCVYTAPEFFFRLDIGYFQFESIQSFWSAIGWLHFALNLTELFLVYMWVDSDWINISSWKNQTKHLVTS